MEHHATHSPSSFPMRAKCPQFNSAPAGSAAERGNVLHEAFGRLFNGVGRDEIELDEFELDGLTWAVDYVKTNMTSAHPVSIEQKVTYFEGFKELYFGTADVLNGDILFDLKTGETRSYWYQMAAYALAAMDGTPFERMTVHVMYSRYRRAHTYTIEKWAAAAAIGDLMNSLEDPNAPANPSEYCAWCTKTTTCGAFGERVGVIAKDWGLESYTIDEIKDPGQLGKAVRLAKVMSIWADSIMKLAKNGDEPPKGFEFKTQNGRKTIRNILGAREALGIPDDELFGACTLSISKLEKIIAASKSIPLREARDVVEETLQTMISIGEPIRKLIQQEEK
jgi:hypothetical protein